MRKVSIWKWFKNECEKHDWIPMLLMLSSMIIIALIMIFIGFVLPFIYSPGR